MPYKRPFKKSYRRYTKRRRMTRNRFSRKSLMYRIARRVVRANAETKYSDFTDSSTVGNLGYLHELTSNIGQGDTQITRDGSRLKIVALKFKYEVIGAGLASDFRQNIRVLVVRGHAESTTPLTVNDVIEYDGTGNAVLSPYTFNNNKKYTILYDRTHTLCAGWQVIGSDTLVPGYKPTQMVKKTLKLNIKVEYNGATTQIMNGGLYVIAIGEELSGANNPQLRYLARTYFTDS